MAEEVHRIENIESWIKLDKPVNAQLIDGSEITLQLFKLVQIVRVLNADDTIEEIIHWEVQPKMNHDEEILKKQLDFQIAEKQAEIDKMRQTKTDIDGAVAFSASADI